MKDQTFWCPVQWRRCSRILSGVNLHPFHLYMKTHRQRTNSKYCFVAGATSALLFPLGGKKTQQHRMSNIITHIKAAATRCCACRGGQRQTQTSIKPSHHTSKCTDAAYHQGVNVEQIRQGGAAKQDNLLVFYRLVKAVTMRGTDTGKTQVAESKIGRTLTCALSLVKSKGGIEESVAISSIALYDETPLKTPSQCTSTCHSHKK